MKGESLMQLEFTFPNDSQQEIPYGYCHCGCGQLTPLAKKSRLDRGMIKGKPLTFISGHSRSHPRFDNPIDLFWHYIQPKTTEECWEWQGPNDAAQGYGRFKVKGVQYVAHRFSYELHNGSIPPHHFVCHFCDNPKCVNPHHLFAGTSQDNHADMMIKRRNVHGKQHPLAKLTDEQIREIRRLYHTGQYRHKDIAALFGVSKTIIGNIVRRQVWVHIE
jgi:hypothetical protein